MHLKTSVDHFNGAVDVSTVDLSLSGWTTGKGYETCLFFPNGESEVVAWYSTPGKAAAGHAAFCNPDVIRFVEQVIHSRDRFRQEVDSHIDGDV